MFNIFKQKTKKPKSENLKNCAVFYLYQGELVQRSDWVTKEQAKALRDNKKWFGDNEKIVLKIL